MSTILADPRTEQVQRNADDVDHIVCAICWKPGRPSLCGMSDNERDGEDFCPEDCPHSTCPLCEVELDRHECQL